MLSEIHWWLVYIWWCHFHFHFVHLQVLLQIDPHKQVQQTCSIGRWSCMHMTALFIFGFLVLASVSWKYTFDFLSRWAAMMVGEGAPSADHESSLCINKNYCIHMLPLCYFLMCLCISYCVFLCVYVFFF